MLICVNVRGLHNKIMSKIFFTIYERFSVLSYCLTSLFKPTKHLFILVYLLIIVPEKHI